MSEEQAKYEVASGYYTPTIDEFHYGFEYEYYYADNESWQKSIVDLDSSWEFINENISLYRVPCLTKEQIEAEGWQNFNQEISKTCLHLFLHSKSDDCCTFSIFYDFSFRLLDIEQTIKEENYKIISDAKVRNISEFRKLIKMLGIK